MVLGVSWLLTLEHPLFTVLDHEVTLSGLILMGGGLFLLYKAVREIFNVTELHEAELGEVKLRSSVVAVVAQIVVIDMIFAVDSVLTAVGMTGEVVLIIVAISIAIAVMMFYAGPVADFIDRHTSVKLLALAFLVLIGVMLILEGIGEPIERTTVYVAILFALGATSCPEGKGSDGGRRVYERVGMRPVRPRDLEGGPCRLQARRPAGSRPGRPALVAVARARARRGGRRRA